MMSVSTASSSRGWSRRLSGYTFAVEPGKVVYVGNLLSRICIGSRGRGNHVMAAIGRVTDRSDRDLPLLVAKYPQLSNERILLRPLPGDAWLWRYKEDENYQPPHGWPPECSADAARSEEYLRSGR